MLSALFVGFVRFAEAQSDVYSLCLQMCVCSLFWQKSTSPSLLAAALARGKGDGPNPTHGAVDSNYPLQPALSFVLCLTLPLTQKHQKEGPGSPRLTVQCCKSSRAHIFSLFCDITVRFWNLYLQTLVSVKYLCLALWGKETEKGCKAVWIDFFFGPEGKLFELFTWLCWTFPVSWIWEWDGNEVHFAVEVCLLPCGCEEHALDPTALLFSGVCNMTTQQHGPAGRAGIWESAPRHVTASFQSCLSALCLMAARLQYVSFTGYKQNLEWKVL